MRTEIAENTETSKLDRGCRLRRVTLVNHRDGIIQEGEIGILARRQASTS